MSLYKKRVSVGSFLKSGEDFKDSDIITIANEGKQIEGTYGIQDVFLVKLANKEEGNVNFNQTTINGLIDAYGKDSIKWVGKEVKVIKIKQNVSGKFKDCYYFAHPDAEFTEDGISIPTDVKQTEEIPVVEDKEEEINTDEIPY